MKSAVTVSLVPEAAGGPFVFWSGLEDAFQKAAQFGFDGLEIFPPDPSALDIPVVRELSDRFKVSVAAVGTGAGWVKHKLHLCHPDLDVRVKARDFIVSMVRRAGQLGAPAILGSMQGRVEPGIERSLALDWLAEGLGVAEAAAAELGVSFFYEPLNRYETNLFNRQLDAAAFLSERSLGGVRILADLFHMNLEEDNLPETILALGPALGHLHFADSNRRAIGFGHTQASEIIEALRRINYGGFLSAEVLPLPDSDSAARRTIQSFRALTSAAGA
jgi:sugar phosphate isomerase/epimerase